MTPNGSDNKWIGKRTIRPDGVDKVTGRATFGADFSQPGMLHGKVLRSPHPHARIKSINFDKAAGVAGRQGRHDRARTSWSFPWDKPATLGIQDLRYNSRNVMARDKALYAGHPVAAVAATSAKIAAAAAQADRGRLRGIALGHRRRRGAAAGRAHSARAHAQGRRQAGPGDDIQHRRQARAQAGRRRGRVSPPPTSSSSAASRPSPCIKDISSRTPASSASPRTASTTIWSSSQGHFMVRDMTAQLTGIKLSDVRAIPAEIGGGFGGKTIVYLEPVALVLSRKSGRPVKMVMTRQEVFRATGPTSGSSSTVKIGATKDGKITAVKATYRLQAGAFPGSPIRGAVGCALSPYDLANVQIIGYDVVTTGPRSRPIARRARRSAPSPWSARSTSWPAALKMDPLVLRQKNAAKEGTKAAYGPTFRSIGYEETLQAALEHPHYKMPLGPNQGRGVASGFWFNAGGESSAQVNVNEDGTVVVVTGHPDIGGSRASMVNIVAEMLGIDYRQVQALIGDTSSSASAR